LQEREFERLGSSRTLRTDARLIAATNRDLEAMVGEQKFRPDLFFRLNVFPVHFPPLRERQADIPLLVRHFTQQFSRRMKKVMETIPSATMDALCRYQWPGNIRELQNVVERAVIISTGPVLSVDVSDLRFSQGQPYRRAIRLAETDKWRAPQRFGGNRTRTHPRGPSAVQLGCGRSQWRGGTSWNEAIHAPKANPQARNCARLCVVGSPVVRSNLVRNGSPGQLSFSMLRNVQPACPWRIDTVSRFNAMAHGYTERQARLRRDQQIP